MYIYKYDLGKHVGDRAVERLVLLRRRNFLAREVPPRFHKRRRREQIRVEPRKVDIRLTEKGNSNSHGARPVH